MEMTEAIEQEQKICYVDCCRASEINSDERTVIADISTDSIDRYKTILNPAGVRLENYVKNPVVLWSHNVSEPPIGKALWVKVMPKSVRAKIRFAKTDFADEIWNLYREGFLNAFSVGFLPIRSHKPTLDEIKQNPELEEVKVVYDEWELLEFSPVCVPANPDSLAVAISERKITLKNERWNELLKAIGENEKKEEKKQNESAGSAEEAGERLYVCVQDLLPEERSIQPKELEIVIPTIEINGRLSSV
ncbi:MAG TPA: HK97 family phage prohead protease [Anaerohalosphaeraceae bacterium]|nr:HK97 family phage prohead protease [Anaerohalosphaeraceae bacterium]